MGIRARFLKAECSLLAATVMLTPLMLCGCNVKPDATETETETETAATETSATETEFVPTPFPSASKLALSDQEAEAEAIKIAERVGLTKEDLRGKYSLFLRYYKAVVTNSGAKDYYAYLFSYFPMIADHIKPEKEDYFLGKVNSVEMGMVETDDFAGGFIDNSIMFNSETMERYGDEYFSLVIYHESLHFIDAYIDGEIGEVYCMEDGTFQTVTYSEHESKGFSFGQRVVYNSDMGYLTEGGAEKYKTQYFTKGSTDLTPLGLEFLVGLEYIFGKETVDDMFFSYNSNEKFCNLLKDNGFSSEDIIRMLRTSVTDEVMTDESQFIDPREVLIRLYKTKIGPDYENDAKFCRIIASMNKDIINSIPTEYRDFINKVTSSASKEAAGLKKAALKKKNSKNECYFEADPYTIYIDGELKLVTMICEYKNDKPLYTSVIYDYDFDEKSVKEISLYKDWHLKKYERTDEDFEYLNSLKTDNSAAHNQTVKGTNPKMTELYKRAEEMGNKHGVYIWFDDLTPEVLTGNKYYYKATNPLKIERALDQIEAVLDLYPEDYFDQLLFGGMYNGIGISLYDNDIPANFFNMEKAVTINGISYYVLYVSTEYDLQMEGDIQKHFGEYFLRNKFSDQVTAVQGRLICDIWDLTDNYILRRNLFSSEPVLSNEDWQKTNYEGFKYFESDEASRHATYVAKDDQEKITSYYVKKDVKNDYFISIEAVASAHTDRHLVYEYLMLSALSGSKPIELTPEQKAKAQELSNGLRKVFNTDKWPAQTAWEKAI